MNLPLDKVLHLVAGGAITALAGCLAGVVKETVDQVGGKGTPDALDSLATSAGGLATAGIMALV